MRVSMRAHILNAISFVLSVLLWLLLLLPLSRNNHYGNERISFRALFIFKHSAYDFITAANEFDLQ